ncbi:MAG TPA: hypothetical protein VF498_17370, partial [Anaerolineales bacterium]
HLEFAPGEAARGRYDRLAIGDGLALTSGGRYIVPVDWDVYCYVAAGLMELTVWGTALLGLRLDPLPAWQQPHERPAWQWTGFARRAGLSIMAFVILGSFIPLFELAFPRPPTRSQQDLAAVLQQGSLLAGTPLADDGLARYLQQPGAVLLEGNSLYPRFYAAGQGDMIDGGEPRAVKDFPRLAFTLQRSSAAAVLLPFAQAPAGLPSGTPVIVLGCKKSGEIRARAVLLTGTGQLLLSNDNPAASCP